MVEFFKLKLLNKKQRVHKVLKLLELAERSIIDNKNNTHKFKWTLPGRNYTAGKIYKVNATVMPAKAFI